MKIHEYQAKELLKKFNVPVLFNKVVFSPEEAGRVAYNDFEVQGRKVVVVKSQVFAGGRGKGIVYDPEQNQPIFLFGKEVRGVNLVTGDNLADKVYQYSLNMFGKKLVTLQTGESGTIIRKILLEEGVKIKNEYYVGIVLDRSVGRNVVMASTEGGVEIEKVAEETPEKILKEWVNPSVGFQDFQSRRLAFGLGLSGVSFKNFISFVHQLVKAYESLDCSLLEINPLVLTEDDRMIALDAKMNFDDNALFRHPEYFELRDITEEDPLEVEASKYDLSYIKLDGNVGCMVNGAGLAMATMDLIQLAGGKPANFLDVGGGADVDRISNAFRIMISDTNVKAVLINIFGGIVRCDKVANGIVEALKNVEVKVPVIVRLDGTNAEIGLEILKNSGLQFQVAQTFVDAAKTVTEVVSKI
ncbi:MAG: ADP-forming succinate--CoA ligase subunit beta [Candidatus Kapaibacteriales bacterium]